MLALKANNKETGDFVTLEEDTYDAAYQRYEEFTGEFGPGVKLFFTVNYLDEAGKKQATEVSGMASIPTSGSLGTKSKLRMWVEGIMGRPLVDGEAVNLEALSNTPCRLVLGIKEGKVRDDGTRAKFNRIEKILPPRKRAARPVAEDSDLI